MLLGLKADLDKIFRKFTIEDYEAFRPPAGMKCHSLSEEMGNAVGRETTDLREQVAFLGGIVANLPPTILNRKRMR